MKCFKLVHCIYTYTHISLFNAKSCSLLAAFFFGVQSGFHLQDPFLHDIKLRCMFELSWFTLNVILLKRKEADGWIISHFSTNNFGYVRWHNVIQFDKPAMMHILPCSFKNMCVCGKHMLNVTLVFSCFIISRISTFWCQALKHSCFFFFFFKNKQNPYGWDG